MKRKKWIFFLLWIYLSILIILELAISLTSALWTLPCKKFFCMRVTYPSQSTRNRFLLIPSSMTIESIYRPQHFYFSAASAFVLCLLIAWVNTSKSNFQEFCFGFHPHSAFNYYLFNMRSLVLALLTVLPRAKRHTNKHLWESTRGMI